MQLLINLHCLDDEAQHMRINIERKQKVEMIYGVFYYSKSKTWPTSEKLKRLGRYGFLRN